jgi:hydrogenase maturation protease
MECSKESMPATQSEARGGGQIGQKTLVVGLGNPILTDDGVGIRVVREIAAGPPIPGVALAEACVGGLRLLDTLAGYERVILVDAIQTRGGTPGDIYRLQADDLKVSLHAGSTHDLTLPGALAFGRGVGMTLPDDDNLIIIAVEVEDVLTFCEECTYAVRESVPRAVEAVLEELGGGGKADARCDAEVQDARS